VEKEILNVIMGLEILSHIGYEKVTANDGVVFCGGAVDTDEQEEMLTKLGWEWDEDNSEWYILVQRDKAAQPRVKQTGYVASTSVGEKCFGCNEYDCRCADYAASSLR